MSESMHEFKYWCGNCQIRVYVRQHDGIELNWQDCPYTCEYAMARRCSTKPLSESYTERLEE